MARRPPSPTLVLAISALVAVGLGGCTASTPEPTPPTAAASSPALPPPASTPVAPPTPGTISSTVPSQKVDKRKPVGLGSAADSADKVAVSITSLKAVSAKAQGPGEVSGPGLQLTVSVDNATGSDFDLSSADVTLTDADGGPTVGFTGPPVNHLPQRVAAGSKARGVYVFTVARGKRNPVTVEVSLTPRVPTVVFRGRAPR